MKWTVGILLSTALLASCASTSSGSAGDARPGVTTSPTVRGTPTSSVGGGPVAFHRALVVRKLAGSYYAAARPKAALQLGRSICRYFTAGASADKALSTLITGAPKHNGPTAGDQGEFESVSVVTLCPRFIPKIEKAVG